jgi:cyanate lyase
MQPSPDDIRSLIVQRAQQHGETLASLSKMIGRNDAYLQQFVRRGTPKRLPEDARLQLAFCLNVDERQLGARDPWKPGDRWPG